MVAVGGIQQHTFSLYCEVFYSNNLHVWPIFKNQVGGGFIRGLNSNGNNTVEFKFK